MDIRSVGGVELDGLIVSGLARECHPCCLVGMYSAVKEDAVRSVELKNGAILQGRKIKVELAKRRAPLDSRHPKGKRKGQLHAAENNQE